jgi:type II secretory pathway pseudopilin PulG
MMTPHPIRRRPRPSEEGYILIWVIFLLAIFTLSLSIAVPRMAKEIQRDREVETMERGKQYIRAVQLYYRKFHAYPPNADALVNTNDIRFLRKKYIDPTTGKDDWKPIRFGQNKTPTAMGFFGQPLPGNASTAAGIGPSGGSGIGGSPFGGSAIGGPGSSSGGSSVFGQSNSGLFGQNNSGTGAGAPLPASGAPTGSPAGSPSGTGSSGSSASSSSDTGLSGQTFGGAGIIGYEPASPKSSILIYKKKTHYNEWEFVYDPLSDMKTISGNSGNIGQPASSTTTPIGSGTSFGPTSTPTTPATPSFPPQQ